jgi:hypothetical protein
MGTDRPASSGGPIERAMIERLLDAYARPGQRAAYYSANGAVTGSERVNATPHWDWTPQAAAGVAGVSTCMFPLALGCRSVLTSEGREWVAPRITDWREAAAVRPPDVWDGRTGEVLRNIEHLAATLPAGGRIRQPDIQSPLGVAELMWDQSFYVELIEHPAAVHGLIDRVTDFIISFVKEVRRVAGRRLNAAGFPPVWADEAGTMLADDTMSLLSPAMHLEFSVPYVNRIAESAGPLFYHSCTWRRRYFDNIHQIRNVRAYNWNPGNSDDPAAIIAEFSGRAVLAPHICLDMHRDNDLLGFAFADEADLLRYMLDAMGGHTCLYFWFSNVVQKGRVIERMYDLLDARGHSPRRVLGGGGQGR